MASQYLSSEKPVVEEESSSTSESTSGSESTTGSTGGSTTTPSTEAPVTETPSKEETVVLEPAPAPEDLPDVPAPDNPNPSAWESLGEPEYTDGSEFAPSGDLGNIGTSSSGPSTGMTWQ